MADPRVNSVKPLALWITGLPGSGKSTLAEGVKKNHPDFIILRMDELRRIVTPKPSYSDSERDMVYRCLAYTAHVLVNNGHSVIIDATGNLRAWRKLARELIPKYAEVYLRCPLEVCKTRERLRRDAHGAPREIYKKGEAGWPVPGLTVPYEEPVNPELLIDIDKTSVADSLEMVTELLKRLQDNS